MISIDLWAEGSEKGGNERHVVGVHTLGTAKVRSLKASLKGTFN